MTIGRLGCAAGAAILAALLGGCQTMNDLLDDKPAGQSEKEESAAAVAPQDVSFVEKADAAGNREVALGELALEVSKTKSVDDLAQQMVTDHKAAGEKLRAIAMGDSIDVPTGPSAAQTAADAGLAGLKGKDFDRAYADTMVKDHEAAVALFESEVAQGSDKALVAFARDTLPTLKMHLEHARNVLASLQ